MLSNKLSWWQRLLTCMLAGWLAVTIHLPVKAQSDGLKLFFKAQQLYQTGQLAPAAIAWEDAANAFAAQGDLLGKTRSLINQSQVLQDLGLYPRACRSILRAFEIESSQCDASEIKPLIERLTKQPEITLLEGIGLRSLGVIWQQKGMLQQAQTILELSAKGTRNSSELGATLLAIGNLQKLLGNQIRDRWSYDQVTEIIDRQDAKSALQPYLASFKTYREIRLPEQLLTQTQAQLNHLALVIEIEAWWQKQTARRIESWQRLEQKILVEVANNFSAVLQAELKTTKAQLIKDIAFDLAQLPPSHEGIYAHLNYAHSLTILQSNQSKVVADDRWSILQTALQQAQQIKDPLGESYALGYLGQNYGQQGDLNQAISLTNQALIVAESHSINSDVREVSYLWQSQLGWLLEQLGSIDEAINAYTLAVNTLQSLRTDLNTNNQVVQFNFRQEVEPIYLRLANLLLINKSSARAKLITPINFPDRTKDNNLELARQVIESLKLAELDNFFQDPCSPPTDLAVTIDDLDPHAAVIYPIELSDRLEVILSMAGQPLQRFSFPIAATKLDYTLHALYDSLNNQSLNNSAVNIFHTTPLNLTEVEENTQILLIPLQELYRCLIEPLESELASNHIETLVFVLSGKLQNVPMAALYDGQQYLLEKYSIALAPSLQLLDTESRPRNQLKVLAAGLSQQVEIRGEIFPALSNVPEELRQIEEIFPRSQRLLDQDFTKQQIEQKLQEGFPIVHLATHGIFSSDPEKTFIITGDQNVINLNALNTLLASSRHQPELIVLSACDTATGDERALLGLAGVAVRSGSTTVASLWAVEDNSTSKLMSQFYRHLKNPGNKKVNALRKAQLSLIKSLRTNPPLPELKQLPPHPYFWASYVLIGNWQ